MKPSLNQSSFMIAIALHASLLWMNPSTAGEVLSRPEPKKTAIRLVPARKIPKKPVIQPKKKELKKVLTPKVKVKPIIKKKKKPVVKTSPEPIKKSKKISTPKPEAKPIAIERKKPVIKTRPEPQIVPEQKVNQVSFTEPKQLETLPLIETSNIQKQEVIDIEIKPETNDAVAQPIERLDEFLGQVRKLIVSNRQYPYMARRQRFEGKVLLRVKIDASGRLLAIEVLNSSGKELFRRAAEKAVRSAMPFPAPAKFGLGDVHFDIPIVYNLIN